MSIPTSLSVRCLWCQDYSPYLQVGCHISQLLQLHLYSKHLLVSSVSYLEGEHREENPVIILAACLCAVFHCSSLLHNNLTSISELGFILPFLLGWEKSLADPTVSFISPNLTCRPLCLPGNHPLFTSYPYCQACQV